MLSDGYDARGPIVLKVDDQWILYYCATSNPQGGDHNAQAVTSHDLVRWTNPQEAFRTPRSVGTSGGPTESPFVVARNGKYYLFVGMNRGYSETPAYGSNSPFHWEFAGRTPG
jgi:arabinan endo-1,5-alpha-L-arabinosidase